MHWNGVKLFFRFVFEVKGINAAIISGHNWFCLFAAYIANLFQRRKAKLIYDSHEFELYRYAPHRTILYDIRHQTQQRHPENQRRAFSN